ncbi:MAG TPA: serine/threonine-protein kinase [Ktedonobacterales bacterium]|nr:serine/threonine-protein kinase [Ktedonobacterales bacterium]
MITCRFCGTSNRADATYCSHCGGALHPVAASSAAGSSVYARSPQASPNATHVPTNGTGRLPPQARLAGRYLVLKNVGQGGMAAVYKATDLRSGSTVAIKEMSQDGLSPSDLTEALASFRSEAKMLASLRHPNLPRVYESFEERARQYLVMEFIDGETLEQRQQRSSGALPQPAVLGWARQLCDVLTYLHSRKPPIVFRDLKPANIMLTPQGQIKLIDFGIARVFAPGRVQDTQVLGTPGFAPPEQYGKAQTDARADVYALGCTLYQLLTGYDPATTPFNLPPMHSRNPAVSPVVQVAIERATKLDRDARYPSVDAFARDLLAGRGAPRTTMAHTAVNPGTTAKTAAASAARAAPANMAAIVVVQPHDVDFGRLTGGQRGTLAITISGQNGALVRGQIKSLVPWLTMDRDRFNGASTIVQLNAETSLLAGTGKQKTTLQIICDNQQLYVPVQVDINPAPARPMKQPRQAAPAPAANTAVKRRPLPSKYAPPARSRSRLPRFATSAVLAFALGGETLLQGRQAITQISAHPLTAPLALGLLMLAALLAGVGAVIGAGGRHWRGRFGTALIGALAGLAAALIVSGPWFWFGLSAVLTHAVTIPTSVLVLLPLLASLGGALGADQFHSRWMLATWGFISRNAPIAITVAGVLGGAYLGYMVTRGAFFGCLAPVGIIVGVLLGVAIARPTARLFRRPVRVRMRP